jgi:phosphoglycerate dehydrogenase-like enzyme
MKVLFCGEAFPEGRRALQRALAPSDTLVVCPEDAVAESLDGVDVVVPAMCRIDESVLAAGNIRLIQQFATGVDGIDLAAAEARGIPVANIPAHSTGNAKAVAELAVMHLLLQQRRYHEAQETVARGELGVPVGNTLVGKRVVVLGLGAVGTEVLRRLLPFEVRAVVVSRRPESQAGPLLEEFPGVEYFSLDRLLDALAGADALMVCLRYGSEVQGLIGTTQLQAMSPGAVVVNVARGPLLDYAALGDALASGHLHGAGLDVFWQEPPDPADPLFARNVTVTPHVGGVTQESYQAMAAVAADNIARLAAGQPLRNRIV